MRTAFTLTLTLTLTMPALAAGVDETADQFVRRVYAQYQPKRPGVSTERPAGTPFYTAALLDAFKKEAAASDGEVGAIDGDPICNCQDHGTLRINGLTITPPDGDTVKARVDFTNLKRHTVVTLTLTRTPQGWRVADVADSSMKSLMTRLQDAIAHPARDAVQEDRQLPQKQ